VSIHVLTKFLVEEKLHFRSCGPVCADDWLSFGQSVKSFVNLVERFVLFNDIIVSVWHAEIRVLAFILMRRK